ncbi:putative nitrate/sulfonate/bicarbonate ABC transporter periplasmic components-like protein [Magnetofaba australis IT-1]|uniref:Putative nitrate/sulfonate/bicarbonate ABC transporter periplasmic components-like protein n=2 Tax=Magnetofaba TaxID=1472292 RepID=A0A1Y2K9D6_9PROT|nr:putative nitrate/sulfonate/bicarbonate ABC transporter periplasmic components-like protein [Magnetofaba australis IT-1]
MLSIVAVALSGCEKPPQELPTLRIAHAPHDHHAPLYVAAMNPDYFKQHGGVWLREKRFRQAYQLMEGDRAIANVEIGSHTGGQELIRRLSEEQYDLSFGGVPAILKYIDKGRSIRMLAPVMAEGAGLVMGVDSPARDWDSFLELAKTRKEPLRIGYKSQFSVQNLIFEHALSVSNVPFSSDADDAKARILLINLNGPKNLIPALKNQLVDGFVIMQPFLAKAEAQGVGKTVAMLHELPPQGKWRGHPCCALAAHNNFLAKHPDLSRKMTALMWRARDLVREKPLQSAKQVAAWLNGSEDVEALSLPTIDFSVQLDESWRRGVHYWIEAMQHRGSLAGQVRAARSPAELDALLYDRALYQQACQEAP